MHSPPLHRRHPGLTILRLFSITVIIAVAWSVGLVGFATSIPKQVADAETRTDAIVVLTGGSGRLDEGLRLLSANLGEKLFISGVYRGIDVQTLLRVSQRVPEQVASRIGIGDALDTAGNAAETESWMRENDFRSLRLVTASYHMPRSLLEFRAAMPGITVIPHPIFPGHVKQRRWWAWPGTATLIVGEYNKLLLAWFRHRLERMVGLGDRPVKV